MKCEYYKLGFCLNRVVGYKDPIIGIPAVAFGSCRCDGGISECPLGMPHLETTVGKVRVL